MSFDGHLVEDLCLVGRNNRVMVIVEDGWFDLVPYKIIMMMMMMMMIKRRLKPVWLSQ